MSLRPHLIWSTYNGAWWRPNAAGYTNHLAAAGVFVNQKFEASREVAVHVEDVRDRIQRRRAELLDELVRLNAVEAALDGAVLNAETDRPVADVGACPIDELELSVRASNGLRNAGIGTVGDLVKLSRKELSALPHLGARSVREVTEVLANLRLRLREETR